MRDSPASLSRPLCFSLPRERTFESAEETNFSSIGNIFLSASGRRKDSLQIKENKLVYRESESCKQRRKAPAICRDGDCQLNPVFKVSGIYHFQIIIVVLFVMC